jgi:DNA-binding CsgD family transcriptional regulator
MGVTDRLAGRRRELGAAADALTGASGNVAMLVVGEAGIGKSRLVAAAAAQAEVTVLFGWCLHLDGLPFLPVIDVLQGLAKVDEGRLLDSALADCPAFVRGEIVRLLPELDDTAEPRRSEPDDGWRRQRLLDSVRRLLHAAGCRRRLAMVIEDVHWADPTTLDLLEYLFTAGHATGVPVVMTSRIEEMSNSAWFQHLHRNPGVRRLDLPPLTLSETAEQIRLLTGELPSASFSAEMYRRSDGNAFFTEQLVSSASGRMDAALPTGLTSLLLSRTAQVPGAGRQVLHVLAVASRPLDEASLAALCERTELEMRDVLRDLLSRLLLRRPDRAGMHQLRHALLAEALIEEMLPSVRRELHGKVAGLLLERNDRTVAAEIAEHLAAAARPRDELRWRAIAAQEADTVFASREASANWQRVIALWDDISDAEGAAGIDLAQVYLHAASSLESAGQQALAATLAEEALTRLAATATAETAMKLHITVGIYRGITSVEDGLASLETAIQIGERLSPSADHVLALINYSHLLGCHGRFEERCAAITKGLHAARQVNDLVGQKVLLMQWALMRLAASDTDGGWATVEAARDIVVEPPNPAIDATFAAQYTDILGLTGDLTKLIEVGLPVLDRADLGDQSDWFILQMLRTNVCNALIELGDVDRAAALVDPLTEGTPTWDRSSVYIDRADLDMRRGRLRDAARFWEDNADLVAAQFEKLDLHRVLGQRAELSLWAGEPAATLPDMLVMLRDSARTDHAIVAGELFVLAVRACADIAEHARATADDNRLGQLEHDTAMLAGMYQTAKADPFAERPLPLTSPAHGLSWRAEWTRLRGESDETAWAQVAAAWDALARPHRAAYARWRQAEAMLGQQRGKAVATTLLRTAARQASARHLPLAQAVNDLARRARIDLAEPTPTGRPEQRRAFGLTERELDVLALLAQGRTNPEIGAALFMSSKTASVHVSNILRKLDVATRVQAAAVAERAGLLAVDEPGAAAPGCPQILPL